MWEYQLVYATYRVFPRRDGHKWKMGGPYDSADEEFIKAEEAAKIRLWADGKWRELHLDPNVDWQRVRGARVIWDPWAECLRLEVDALNSFGQLGWEVVAVYPHEMPVGEKFGRYEWWGRPNMTYVLKRALPHAPDQIELSNQRAPES